MHSDSSRLLDYIENILHHKKSPSYVLLNPGPVITTPRVKAALVHHDISHRDEDFSFLVKNIRKKLKQVFQGDDQYEVVPITGSGTSSLEAAISSAVPADKKILIVMNGAFGERYLEIAQTHNLNYEVLDFGWANVIDTEKVRQKIESDPQISTVMMAHHETSVGLLNPLSKIGNICRQNNALFIVDAVASLGAENINVVRDKIDICLSSANKAIHAIAGVAFACVNNRAWKQMENIKPRVYYLNLKRYRQYAVDMEQTPFTPAVSSFYALDAALDELMEDGLEKRWEIYRKRNQDIKNALKKMGLEFLTSTGQESNTLNIVKVPEFISFTTLYKAMKSFGYIIYNCKDDFEDKYFQISNMGDLSETTIREFLNTLNFVLFKAAKTWTNKSSDSVSISPVSFVDSSTIIRGKSAENQMSLFNEK
ncbi:MAG: pyridoxal-phosphate-dependent aminotransferase family protein [Myxococcota bacterium]